MRWIPRAGVAAITAAVLAATAVAPSAAGERPTPGRADDGNGLTGTGTGTGSQAGGESVTVTLVTGDRLLVTTDAEGRSAATALPGPDGHPPALQTRTTGSDLYVYPERAASALAHGTVDEELFNVTGLIRQGYDDAASETIPLIAVYDGDVDVARSLPALPRGAGHRLTLPSARGVALDADKERAGAFWDDATSGGSRAGRDLAALWLDRRVEETLDRSVRQIGADAAWEAGYDGTGTTVAVLDTGADAEHPDLAGRITAAENFTDSGTTDDLRGHGTHTISTVGGSGAASGGERRGVAPGAALLNGKVLNDYGSGQSSWIIAGMEWAVAEGADVVSMSLGSPEPTDCADPMSAAAEELATTTDTLFVVAAGNAGPALNTVSSPGCAPGVLTVGAVDRDDSTAGFSSRGPAAVTHTLKPEIAAPGVSISAAAAGGRGVYAYQEMSGTSMATPHVAGAAALVRQAHPEWTAGQTKAALVSSAETAVPGDVRETGGGRLDAAAATTQAVLGAPAVQGGAFSWPQHSSDPTTVELPYTNTTDRPLALSLAPPEVTGNDGSRVRSGVARLGERRVTVPAGGTVTVPLRLDPTADLSRAQYGDLTGRVVATGDGVRVVTPFALHVEPETVSLRVKLVDRDGEPAAGTSSLDLVGIDAATGERRVNGGAIDQAFRVRPGTYFLSAFVTTSDSSLTYLARPEVEVTRDTTLVLDAREAHRLSVATDRDSEVRGSTFAFSRTWDQWLHYGTAFGGRALTGRYARIEGAAREGEFEFGSYWRTAAPLIEELSVVGGPELDPLPAHTGASNLDGTGEARLVDAGSGTPAELADAGAEGAVALVEFPDDRPSAIQVADDAEAAGAVAVVAHRPTPGRWLPAIRFDGLPLPVLAVESDEAADLAQRLSAGEVTLRWDATAVSPHQYNLAFHEDGRLTSARDYRPRDHQLARVDATYHAMGQAGDYTDYLAAYRPSGAALSVGHTQVVPSPGTRTEFYAPGEGTAWNHILSSSYPWGESMTDRHRVHRAGERREESWYDGVIAPVAPRDENGEPVLAAERQGHLMGLATAQWGDGSHHGQAGSFGDIGRLTLYRDGEEVGSSAWPFGAFEVEPEEATYRLEQRVGKYGEPSEVWHRSTAVDTAWTFRSALDPDVHSQPLPVMFPRYTLPEDGMKTLAAEDGLTIGLSAQGHLGYEPGPLASAALSWSYDGGATWTEADVDPETWTATVDHAGASGEQVTLRAHLTDAAGNSVTQTVARAYDVR
ncbi:S8 family serine peptidase [Streptomyces sp. SBT349]|uniref:S8 family serine peptidase n=1 Tax=Streptomyces sp. SBT349 TaxID=1580539 RepID=UPI00066B2FAA|nr:S8 family serine peptidase [Streptomyces sp. SBT349]